MKTVFLVLSTLLPLYSPVPYIRSILAGATRPHRTTRLVYLVIGILTTLSLLVSGDRVALWISAVSLLQAIVLFFLGLKYGMGGWAKMDIACLILAIAGIIAWQTTDNPLFGLYFGIGADFMGTVPTLIKTWRNPSSEEPTFYILDATAGVFNMLALTNWAVGDFAYPLYLFLVNALVALLVLRPKTKKLQFDVLELAGGFGGVDDVDVEACPQLKAGAVDKPGDNTDKPVIAVSDIIVVGQGVSQAILRTDDR